MNHRLAFLICGLLAPTVMNLSASAQEFSRFALDSVTVQDGADNTRNFAIGGADLSASTVDGEPLGPSYGLAPFRFHPRDFSLGQIESINGARLALTNDSSTIADTGQVEIFYVPDSRTDLGLDLENDPNPQATADDLFECSWGEPEACYTVTYDPNSPAGINPADFSAAPISLGQVEIDFGLDEFTSEFELDIPAAVAVSLAERINAGEGFHLAFGAEDDFGFTQINSFGALDRPQLTLEASGPAGVPTRDLIRQGAIHGGGDTTGGDFYGSGNDDGFSEFGIANFQFSKEDFGVADDITEIGSVQLTLHHNERSFSDGEEFEIFLVSDTAEELGFDEFLGYLGRDTGDPFPTLVYDSELDNGVNADQFGSAPVSLGVLPYDPKFGGTPETFDLALSEEATAAIAESINAGDDFHLLIAVTDANADVTFSGLNNAFDPGNPQLSISLDAAPITPDPPAGLDFNGDGSINADDAALYCDATGGGNAELLAAAGIVAGDTDFNGAVDFADFLSLSSGFGGEGTWEQGDFDCSGDVAFADFLALSGNFGTTAGATSSVPEPNGSLLAFLGIFALASVRRRRS